MRTFVAVIAGMVLALMLIGASGLVYLRSSGLDSRDTPSVIEARASRAARAFAVPDEIRLRRNPVMQTPDTLTEGLAHFADHCAICHSNDGSGNTEMGRGFYPKVPDMRLPTTQELSDGQLFYVIEHGIRFTGMPAWSTGTKAGEESTWHLVQFIRHLPRLTEAELDTMKQLSPRSPEDIRQEIEEERFLNQ